jgi:phage recombination protein Bet
MSAELTRQEPGAVQPQATLTDDQVRLLKDTVCKGATDNELRLFMQVCTTKRLDPFSKQIHAVKRWDRESGREVMTFQTGIDGLRLIAERSGQYRGQTDPLWCGEDGVWKDVWLAKTPPAAAKVGVHRVGFPQPLTRVAKWAEYCQRKKDGTAMAMWATMPTNQLAKCAEALSLRAAFPEELSGLYADEEMDQAHHEPNGSREAQQDVAAAKLAAMKGETPAVHDAQFVDEPPPNEAPPAKISFKALESFKEIKAELKKLGAEARYYGVLKTFGAEKSNQLNEANARDAYRALGAELKAIRLAVADREETDNLYASLVVTHGAESVDSLIGREGHSEWADVPLSERDELLGKLREHLA